MEGKHDSGLPPTPTSTEPQSEKGDKGGRARKTSRTTEPFDQSEREEMERLLEELQGHLGMRLYFFLMYLTGTILVLVLYPTRFLEGEDNANNFLFNADRCVTSFFISILSKCSL